MKRIPIVLFMLLGGCSFSGSAGEVDMEFGQPPESKTVREVHYREVTTTTSSRKTEE